MATQGVNMSVPFETLVESVQGLSVEHLRRLLEVLTEAIEQAEEAAWEQDPVLQAEVQEARTAFSTGDYVSLDAWRSR